VFGNVKYCSHCQAGIEWKIPAGDNRHRHVCSSCNTIFYDNPRMVAGTLPVHEGHILLCKRAIEPRKGYWTLPAGFMENGESTEEGALRETWEEAKARVELKNLLTMITVPHISQVHIFFLADLPAPEFAAGEESLEVALFHPDDIPWDEIAFPTVTETLKRYLAGERETQVFDIRPEQALGI
tara:strand:+ start:16838 stop:17386 length:549 start_codon:yes stop_codon:yes gene_type:complete